METINPCRQFQINIPNKTFVLDSHRPSIPFVVLWRTRALYCSSESLFLSSYMYKSSWSTYCIRIWMFPDLHHLHEPDNPRADTPPAPCRPQRLHISPAQATLFSLPKTCKTVHSSAKTWSHPFHRERGIRERSDMRFWNCWISIGCHPVSHYPTQSDLLFSSCNCLFFQTKATVSIQSYLKGQYREPVSFILIKDWLQLS